MPSNSCSPGSWWRREALFRDFEHWARTASLTSFSRADAKLTVEVMAAAERRLTQAVLQHASAVGLAADGLARTYQVQARLVLWKLPPAFPWLQQLEGCGWLDRFGPRGPWVMHRVIGMRELPAELDTAGKVREVIECLRRAAAGGGDLAPALLTSVKSKVVSWASDGADSGVGDLAAAAELPNMSFRQWDESHAAVKLLPHAVRAEPDCDKVEKLLVSSKDPPSLAKFVSTSDVFRKKFGDAQLKDCVAIIQNLGWAPQRFSSRARPMMRQARRWKQMFESLALEAAGRDQKEHQMPNISSASLVAKTLGGYFSAGC